MDERKSDRSLGSVRKCLEVVEALAQGAQPLGVSEVARAVGAPRASVHQRLATLLDAGWVEQGPDARYRLSVHVAIVGQAALEQAQLGSLMQSVLEELAERTREAISLAVLDGGEAVIVQRVESSEHLRADLRVGARMSLAESASGLVLLAFGSPAQREQVAGLGVTVPDDAVLDAIREDGVAVVRDRFFPGLSAAAAPVFGHRFGPSAEAAPVEAALSLAAPTSRFDESSAVTAVRDAARRVNSRFAR